MTQQFSAYLKLAQLPAELKAKHHIKIDAVTPRFDLVAMVGYYKPIGSLTNKKGMTVFSLINAEHCVHNTISQRMAEKLLRAKDNINFSSVYLLSPTASASGYLYGFGNPMRCKTYSKKQLPNPFFECRNDGYFFLIAKDWSTIEVLVMPNGYNTIIGCAQALADGVYNEAIEAMRATASACYNY